MISEDADRSAKAIVTLALFDGKEVHIWQGITTGTISKKLLGANGFGWDDMFIPDGQTTQLTFAQMSDLVKDKYSMRKKAIKNFASSPPQLNYPIYMLPEPFEQEMNRVQVEKLQDKKAQQFAYSLESLAKVKVDKNFKANLYTPVEMSENTYFTRFLSHKRSKSIGLLFTDVDRKHLNLYQNGLPKLWQVGPERRQLALAQRTEYFLINQNEKVEKILTKLEKTKASFPKRSNHRSETVEKALGFAGYSTVTSSISLKEIGYKKRSAVKEVSRTEAARHGLFNIIGKYPRSIYALGSMPAITGWRDTIVMGAIGHMMVFVHRNSINAINFQNQIDLINEARKIIIDLNLGERQTKRAIRNIGAALGSHPKEDVEKAIRLHKEAGVSLFRIYTINSDPRVIDTAAGIRQALGGDVEIFVGQLSDKRQALRLIEPDIAADGLVYGHGGGRQCTSATNGMALTTLEELYDVFIDPRFNQTSVLVEGGMGSRVGALYILGVDCILRNAQFANCVVEQGEIYFEHKSGDFCQPYHGSASAATMIIESYSKNNVSRRLNPSGRTRNVEGKSGYIFYGEKANSMAFYVDQFRHYAGRMLADLGVENISELREFLASNNEELIRIVSADAEYTSDAYKS